MAFPDDVRRRFLDNRHDYVKVAGIDADGILRGKLMQKKKFQSILGDGFGFCSVIFGWDMLDRTYTKELGISSAANGYGDLTAVVDGTTYREIPWENDVPFFLVKFNGDDGKPIAPCPRSLLASVTDKFETELNGIATAGAEFEFFMYKEDVDSIHKKNFVDLKPLTPGMFGYSLQRPALNSDFYYGIADTCKAFDVELEGWHTETGPGVYEAAIAYDTAVRMADKASLFKLLVKSVSPRYGMMPSFMAKPKQGLPGNSGHIHVSVMDKNSGKNLFSRPETDLDAPWDDIKDVSDFGRHFIAGVLDGLSDIMPLFAPNINSYKRLVENFWAPVTVSWGLENRIASIRLISPGPGSKSTRLEVRTPGADVHPHYAMAAIFALGYRGVTKKLPLTIPPISKTATTNEGFERLPRSLETAVERFAAEKSIAREVLGDAFVDHYANTRREELAQWNDAVTNWETARYMETV